MTIVTRVLAPGDESVLMGVAPEVFDNPVDPDLVAEFLNDPRHHIAVAIDDGVVVGFASGVHYVHPDKRPELWINEVAVAPTHQRRGLGKAVTAALLEVGRDHECQVAWVLTDASNAAAMALYASLGGTEGADDEASNQATIGYSFELRGIRSLAAGRRRPEDEERPGRDQGEADGVVHRDPLAQIEDQEGGEDGEGDHLLHRLQLGGRIDGRAETVGRHGQAVFEEGNSPADDDRQPERPAAELQVAVPGEGHEYVRSQQQDDRQELRRDGGHGRLYVRRSRRSRPRKKGRVRHFGGASGSASRRFGKRSNSSDQGHLGLQPGQRRADADVGAAAERHVRPVLAADVEAVRVVEHLRIAVGGAQREGHRLGRLAPGSRRPPCRARRCGR